MRTFWHVYQVAPLKRGLACGVNTVFGPQAGKDNVFYTLILQMSVQVRAQKRAVEAFIKYVLCSLGRKRLMDLIALKTRREARLTRIMPYIYDFSSAASRALNKVTDISNRLHRAKRSRFYQRALNVYNQ